MENDDHLRSLQNTYLGLIFLTACSMLIGEAGILAASLSRPPIEAILLVLASVKIALVSLNFMELRFAPKWLVGLMAGWICLLTAILVAFVIPFPPT